MYLLRLLFIFSFIGLFFSKSNAQVNADFSANLTTGCGSLAVSFSDLSASPGASIVDWNWDLGGVAVMTQQAGRIFPEGSFEICLTVIDNNGNSDTECKTDYIKVNEIPTADFDADIRTGCSPLEVSFVDLSDSPDGTITQWIWGIGGAEGVVVDDGTLTTIDNIYSIPDLYNINLTVTDDNGCIGTVTKQDFIMVSPDPDIQISADNQFQCNPPFTVNFTNQNPEANIEYTWNFGNGESFTGVHPPAVTYTEPGQYDVQVMGMNTMTQCGDTLLEAGFISVGYPVEFTFDKTEICAKETVSFEDISGSSADDILWDFGDGNTSTEVNPSHVYNTSGCFTVSLTRNEIGCATTVESDICIEVKPQPIVSFTTDTNSNCSLPHVVNFTGIGNDVVSWFWEFGENSEAGTSTDQNPIVTFTEFGIYPIFLTVTDLEGCSRRVSSDTIRLIELNAALPDGQIKGCTPVSFTLEDASVSSAPITNWYWEIATPSGVLSSSDPMPSFSIVDTGCYDVKLFVTNAQGCVDSSLIPDVVCVGMVPNVDFEGSPLNACIDKDVIFTDLSDSFANEWFWDFGDSTFAFEPDPMHEYADTGTFDVTLIATHHGCSSFEIKEDYVTTLGPKAKMESLRKCNSPFDLELKNISIGADEISWDFGDPTTTTDVSTLDSVVYTYPDTGMYTITLATHNFASGCRDTARLVYYITDPLLEFSLDVTEGCVPLVIEVTNISLFAEEYEWVSSNAEFSDIAIAEPEITFNAPGTYTDLQLITTEVNGCKDTLDFAGEIKVNAVSTDFTTLPAVGCNPLPVQFQNSSSSLYGNIVSYDWDIGNGMLTTTDPNPSLTFDTVGTFPASLTVTDDWGCIGTLVLDDAVKVTQPTSKFKVDTLGCTSSIIEFKNQSQGTSLTYQWDFGDGGTSTAKNPNHNYIAEGTYTVCLTVTDANNCTHTFCREDYIKIKNPIAAFTSDVTVAACPPLIVNFENNSQDAVSYEWNFGDGSGSSNLENPPHVYTTPGVFDVTLIAIADDVCQDTIILEDYISLDGPDGSFTFQYDEACIPTEVTFFAESNDFYTYIWDYGDGILDTTGFKMADTVTHLYSQNFDFLPNLILVDNQGCLRAIPPVDTIGLVYIESEFEASLTELCNDNTPITFTNLYESSIPIVGVEWTFEGGIPATSTDMNPEVMFLDPGSFDVTLIIDNGECRDTMIKEDYIKVREMPHVDFVMNPMEGCAPLVVNFTDVSTVGTSFIQGWNWDFGNGQTSTNKNPTHTFPEGGNIPIQLRVITDDGCQDSMMQNLVVHPQVFLTISSDTVICNGESVELLADITSDTTGVTYFWKNNPTLSCTDCKNPTAIPTDTTTYTFVAISSENCQYEIDVTVNVRPESVPIVTISNDTTICAGDVAQIFASGGDNLFGYKWDHSATGLSCYDACLNPIASPISNTTYTVTVTNTSGCSSTASTTVSVFYEFQNILGEDRTICLGDTAHLQIQTGNNPTWIVSDGLSCTVCPNPIAAPLETMDYVVKVESNFGCDIIDSIRINVLSSEDIDAGEAIEICIGQTAQLTGFGDGIPLWSPATSLNQTDIFNPVAQPDSTTTYLFSLENGDCILTDSVEVQIIEKTNIELLDQFICEGEAVTMQPIGFADNFTWSPPEDLSHTDIENPLASPRETKRYTVIASLGTCEADTASAIVEVTKRPLINVPPLYRFFPGEPLLLNADGLSGGGFAYQWVPAIGLSCSDCPSPTALLDSSRNYVVIITDLLTGCSSTQDVRVQLESECSEELISMPNAFSPNGDGNNDKYQMYSGIIDEIEYFRVFNRWGAIVYESNDRFFNWDGMFNGKSLPEGVYIYVLAGKCAIDGSTIIKKGDITIHK